MDKLEPIIRNRFWILAGLVIPLGLWAYFSANGALKAATEKRVTDLKSVLSGVSSGNEPNQDYTEKLEKINEVYTGWVDEERMKLWEMQQERMVWPSIVASEIPEEFMGNIENDQTFAYQHEYKNFMKKLVEYAQPVMPEVRTTKGAAKPVAWKQKIILAADLPASQFGALSITPEQMWNAQIDIWLTTLLLDSIRDLNQDKDSVTEAILRRVDRLELFGGSGEPLLAGGAGGDPGMDGGEDMYDGMMDTGSGIGGPGQVASQVAFSPAQEFGPAGSASTGGDSDMYAEQPMAGATGAEELRYIAESEESPFLERGFYMSVIIMQNKIPEFITELTNSDWPIRVERFQMGTNPYFTEKVSRSQLDSEFGYDPEYGNEMSGNPGRNYDYGGTTMEGGRTSGEIYGNLITGLPEYATGALNHPDLVQLDLTGVITMYKQPTELIEKLQAEATAETAGGDGIGVSPVNVPEEPTPETTPTDPEAINPGTLPEVPASDPELTPAAEPEGTVETPTTAPEEEAPLVVE